MASTLGGRHLTEAHRLIQQRIGVETTTLMIALFKRLDPSNLDRTTERWLGAAVPVIAAQRVKSIRAAANYMTRFRDLETAGTFTPRLAPQANVTLVTTSLTIVGPVSIKRAMSAGSPLDKAVRNAISNVAGAGMRQALNGGRETITTTVAADPKALGWARAASGNACAFCAMLASRGPVYGEDGADFEAHDRCSCSAEPVYSRDAPWPAGSEQYRQQWDEATAGKGGADAIRSFRGALAGDTGDDE